MLGYGPPKSSHLGWEPLVAGLQWKEGTLIPLARLTLQSLTVARLFLDLTLFSGSFPVTPFSIQDEDYLKCSFILIPMDNISMRLQKDSQSMTRSRVPPPQTPGNILE